MVYHSKAFSFSISLRLPFFLAKQKKEKIKSLNQDYSPDDASIKEREDEVEGNRAPRHKMVHPRPEMSLQREL